MISEEMTLNEYCTIVDGLLHKHYGITLVDAGLTSRDLENPYLNNETPTEWMEWYADKYDLFELKSPENWLGDGYTLPT